MSFEILIEMLFEMLIKVLIDDLIKFSQSCIQRWCVRCIDKFPILPKNCTWRWNDQIHWRVFDDVKKAASWWSSALADLTMMPEKLHLDDWMHWQIDGFAKRLHLKLRRSDALTNFRVFVRKLHLTMKLSDTLTSFRFVKKLHLTLKRSDALTNWRVLSKNCIWLWNSQMHWRVFDLFRCLDYRYSGEIFDCVVSLSQLHKSQADRRNEP